MYLWFEEQGLINGTWQKEEKEDSPDTLTSRDYHSNK